MVHSVLIMTKFIVEEVIRACLVNHVVAFCVDNVVQGALKSLVRTYLVVSDVGGLVLAAKGDLIQS